MKPEEMKSALEEMEQALLSLIMDLKPVSTQPDHTPSFERVTFDHCEHDNSKWQTLVSEYLKTALHFEIHCWNDESEWIKLALQHGKLKDDDWQHGKIITGPVTAEFAKMLLDLPKPTDTELYNKMTPFFSVFLDDRFQSCHYGTENCYK